MDFDNQAKSYDARIKLPLHVPGEIAKKLTEHISSNSRLLEVGVGTGEISFEIAKLVSDYTGFDKSAGMIDIFLNRYADNEERPNVSRVDGDKKWPVENQSIDVVFSSKALHLLNEDHVLTELDRIKGDKGLTLFIGSVKKEPSGIDAKMRKKMHEILKEYGVVSKGGEGRRKKFFKKCVARGAELLEPITVAQWEVNHSPDDSINSWKKVEGLAGNPIADNIKDKTIERLEDWAEEEFGSLTIKQQSYRRYLLNGVTFKNN